MFARNPLSNYRLVLVCAALAACDSGAQPSTNPPAGQTAVSGTGAAEPAKPASTQGASGTTAGSATPASANASAAGGGGGGAGKGSAPAGGTSAAAAGAQASAGSMAAGATAGSAAGSGGSAGANSNFKACVSEDLGPCGTFMTQAGVTLQLGSYGAVMEKNVGKGFEAKLASGDSDDGSSCASVVASFGEDPEKSKPLLDTKGIDFALYTVYRPAVWPEQPVPVITWGNGTCAKTEGYGALLRYVASHGFFVIAANSRWVGSGNQAMIKALDFVEAAAKDSQSPYYQHLDTTKIGAMGHSQGGMATISAAQDKRVQTVIIWNGGSKAVKPFLAVSGDMDIGSPTVSSMKNALTGNPPGAYLFYHKVVGTGTVPGHLTLMTEPERVVEPTAAWFKYQLLKDSASSSWFVGKDCKLCATPADFEYGQMGLQ